MSFCWICWRRDVSLMIDLRLYPHAPLLVEWTQCQGVRAMQHCLEILSRDRLSRGREESLSAWRFNFAAFDIVQWSCSRVCCQTQALFLQKCSPLPYSVTLMILSDNSREWSIAMKTASKFCLAGSRSCATIQACTLLHTKFCAVSCHFLLSPFNICFMGLMILMQSFSCEEYALRRPELSSWAAGAGKCRPQQAVYSDTESPSSPLTSNIRRWGPSSASTKPESFCFSRCFTFQLLHRVNKFQVALSTPSIVIVFYPSIFALLCLCCTKLRLSVWVVWLACLAMFLLFNLLPLCLFFFFCFWVSSFLPLWLQSR